MSSLYINEGVWQAAFITLVLGGGCALLTGRAIASTWRSIWTAVIAALPLSFALRFVHFALYQEPLLSGKAWLFEFIIVLAVACLAFQRTRTLQMLRQYYWLYEANGLLRWRLRQDAPQSSALG